MILSDLELRNCLKTGEISIDPTPEDSCIQPASIDLKLGPDLTAYTNRFKFCTLKPGERCSDLVTFPIEAGYRLKSGEFILGSTLELVRVGSTVVMRLDGKSSLGRLGLVVHVTSGFIDPGFNGQITLELFNMNRHPILLTSGMRIAQVCVERVCGTVGRPYGSLGLGSHYQGQMGPTGPK